MNRSAQKGIVRRWDRGGNLMVSRPDFRMLNLLTLTQWQEAVDASQNGIEIDSLFQYGLIRGVDRDGTIVTDSPVRLKRCLRILEEGRKRGITPTISL